MRPKREGNKGRLRFINFYFPFNEPLREPRGCQCSFVIGDLQWYDLWP